MLERGLLKGVDGAGEFMGGAQDGAKQIPRRGVIGVQRENLPAIDSGLAKSAGLVRSKGALEDLIGAGSLLGHGQSSDLRRRREVRQCRWESGLSDGRNGRINRKVQPAEHIGGD